MYMKLMTNIPNIHIIVVQLKLIETLLFNSTNFDIIQYTSNMKTILPLKMKGSKCKLEGELLYRLAMSSVMQEWYDLSWSCGDP